MKRSNCASCGGSGCSKCSDNFRGLTVHVDNSRGVIDEDPLCEKIDLCPGACVYSYELAAHWTGEGDPPEVLATLHLSDSRIVLLSMGCLSADLRANLPGLCFPAFAKLCVESGVDAALVLVYGECSQ